MKFIKVLFEKIKFWFDTQNEFKYKVVEQKKKNTAFIRITIEFQKKHTRELYCSIESKNFYTK
jgi:hypothetical protein